MPADAFVARIMAEIDSGWSLFGGRPVLGSVTGGRLRIFKRLRYRNSLQTMLTAEIVPQGNDTLLRCQLGPHNLGLVVYLVALAVSGLVAAAAVPTLLDGPSPQRPLAFAVVALRSSSSAVVCSAVGSRATRVPSLSPGLDLRLGLGASVRTRGEPWRSRARQKACATG